MIYTFTTAAPAALTLVIIATSFSLVHTSFSSCTTAVASCDSDPGCVTCKTSLQNFGAQVSLKQAMASKYVVQARVHPAVVSRRVCNVDCKNTATPVLYEFQHGVS